MKQPDMAFINNCFYSIRIAEWHRRISMHTFIFIVSLSCLNITQTILTFKTNIVQKLVHDI